VPTDLAILDEAIRRFPYVLRSVREIVATGDYNGYLHPSTIDMIRREYWLMIDERRRRRKTTSLIG
jgi:hypothetical protein